MVDHIMPPIPPIPGVESESFGASVMTHSAVERREAIPAASINAVLTTFKQAINCTKREDKSKFIRVFNQ